MATERRSFPPLMWVNGLEGNNVVVLTADVLYLATVKKDGLAHIDLGLEEGKQARQLLPAKTVQIPLANVVRIQFKQVRSKSAFEEWMNKDLTVTYRDRSRVRNLKLSLASETVRDEVAQNLNDRAGPWPIAETPVSPYLILARYLYIIAVLSLVTIFFSWLEISGYWNREGAGGAFGSLLNRYFDAFGVWGIFVPGFLVCVIVLISGIRQLRTPPILVTYEKE